MNFNTFLIGLLFLVIAGLGGAFGFPQYALIAATTNGMPVRVEMTTFDFDACDRLVAKLTAMQARKTLKFACVRF